MSRKLRRGLGRAAGWLAPLLAACIRLLAFTWRVEQEGPDPYADGRCVGALWHHGILAAAGVFRDRGIHVSVSRSRDGELAVGVIGRLGFGESPRGSSGARGVSLARSIVRLLRAGRPVAVLPDGPLGPARRAKPGVVLAARLAGQPIVPVALAARPCVELASWDRTRLPLPFARVVCVVGEPLAMQPGADDDALALELARQLDAAESRAAALLTS